MKTLVSPYGHEIEGTNTKLLGITLIQSEVEESSIDNNGLDIELAGETKICWDSKETIVGDDGFREFVDVYGNVWSEADLHFIDEDEDVTEPQRLFPEAEKAPLPNMMKIPLELDMGQLRDIQDLIERGIDAVSKEASSKSDSSDSDRENAKALEEVGSMVIASIQEATKELH